MAEIVRMPKMSDTMTEGVVAKWHKKVGDSVKSGDLVAEIETENLAEFDRVLRHVRALEGVSKSETSLLLTTI